MQKWFRKMQERLEMEDINEQYLNEFLEALQTSINQMSADGIRISYVPSKSMELGNIWQMYWMSSGKNCVVWRSSLWELQAFPTMRHPRN